MHLVIKVFINLKNLFIVRGYNPRLFVAICKHHCIIIIIIRMFHGSQIYIIII